MFWCTSAYSSSLVKNRAAESTSPPPTHRMSFNGTEEYMTDEGLLRPEMRGKLQWSRRFATCHARAEENRRRMVVGTGRLYHTRTSTTSFQETPRHRGRYTSAVAVRSIRFGQFETDNDGITFLLALIDVFTKVAWCVPLKNKSAASLVAALTTTFTKGWPKTLQTDQGLEFLNQSVQGLLRKYGIHHFSTHNAETKASIVERFNRTLKTRMWRHFTKHQTWRYIDVLQDLIHIRTQALTGVDSFSLNELNAGILDNRAVYVHVCGSGSTPLHVRLHWNDPTASVRGHLTWPTESAAADSAPR